MSSIFVTETSNAEVSDLDLIDLRDDPQSVTINVVGEIDIANAPRLHERLSLASHTPGQEIVVDLREVSFIDSTGLGVLVNARRNIRAAGCTMRLLLPEGRARFPFEVTGLIGLFEGARD